ncbi:hypothetical protein PAF17_00345 [Paracoccus sp. Z330]|uniref:Uncharacterized protein n=1 Tax=Paracoccus onchidii TaxID=3017813 RepID=A0ABT4Z9L0_9RHOB|nr:hypothetical protein [Paracoccus onchidii]MDB6175955.1 hypothetical protein [Paracoccus onchidii]
MRPGFAGWLACGFALVATRIGAEPVLSAEERAILPRVLQAVHVDISQEHIGAERAVLLASRNPDAAKADLVILAGEPDDNAGQPLAIGRDLVWMGLMAGQVPRLDVTESGGLRLHAEQIGIGRSPWEETLTLAEREGQIRIAGYTLKQWDRLTAASATCDWNLLTGNWVQDVTMPAESDLPPIHHEGNRPAHYLLSDWNGEDHGWPDFCMVDLTAF